MTLTAFLLIFVSVFLHAGWNFISKKSTPSAAFYMLSSATAALIWFGFFLHSGISCSALPGRFWWILAFSWFGEMLYCIGLAYGYRRGDISLVYPLPPRSADRGGDDFVRARQDAGRVRAGRNGADLHRLSVPAAQKFP